MSPLPWQPAPQPAPQPAQTPRVHMTYTTVPQSCPLSNPPISSQGVGSGVASDVSSSTNAGDQGQPLVNMTTISYWCGHRYTIVFAKIIKSNICLQTELNIDVLCTMHNNKE